MKVKYKPYLPLMPLLLAILLTACQSNNIEKELINQPMKEGYVNHIQYPKVFQAWSPAANLEHLTEVEQLASHDLVFHGPYVMHGEWNTSKEQPYEDLAIDLVTFGTDDTSLIDARAFKAEVLALNPEFKVLCEIHIREAFYVDPDTINEDTDFWDQGALPGDSVFWLRDENGQVIPSWGEDTDEDGKIEVEEAQSCLVDFTRPDFQELVVKRVKALYESGLFDGVFFDWWNESHHTLVNLDYSKSYKPLEEEVAARVNLLKKIREVVPKDFLILVNANYDTLPQSAPYINGLYMECYKSYKDEAYSDEQLRQIESTLLWAEDHLAEPRINCVEGWRYVYEYSPTEQEALKERDTPLNQQGMRLFTTLTLTLSDGYVLFSDDNALPTQDHIHNYYELWLEDLGMPKTDTGVRYQGKEHVYIREFDKGIVIYNGSNEAVLYEDRSIPAYDGAVILSKVGQ